MTPNIIDLLIEIENNMPRYIDDPLGSGRAFEQVKQAYSELQHENNKLRAECSDKDLQLQKREDTTNDLQAEIYNLVERCNLLSRRNDRLQFELDRMIKEAR